MVSRSTITQSIIENANLVFKRLFVQHSVHMVHSMQYAINLSDTCIDQVPYPLCVQYNEGKLACSIQHSIICYVQNNYVITTLRRVSVG